MIVYLLLVQFGGIFEAGVYNHETHELIATWADLVTDDVNDTTKPFYQSIINGMVTIMPVAEYTDTTYDGCDLYLDDYVQSIYPASGKVFFAPPFNVASIIFSNGLKFVTPISSIDDTNQITTTYNNVQYIGSNSNPYFMLYKISDDVTSVEINENTKFINQLDSSDAKQLSSITLPSSLSNITSQLTSNNPLLKNENNLHGNAYYVGNSENPYLVLMEAKDTTITECEINPNTKFIGPSAFSNCTSLTTVSLPASVTNIEEIAFLSSGLTSITIPDSVIKIDLQAFGQTQLTTVTLPNSIEYLGRAAFNQCRSLTTINIPEKITFIPDNFCYFCNSLTNVTIHDNIEIIGRMAFFRAIFTSFDFGKKLKCIKRSAFSNCTNLNNVVLPNTIKRIEQSAFASCSSLTKLTVLATTPPNLVNTNAFPTNLATIYVPKGSLDLYKTATNWASFADKFVELS